MSALLNTFKTVSIIFPIASVDTGLQAVIDPVGFSRSFGLPVTAPDPYISLMGVRQLATGITLLTSAWQGQWNAMATILAIMGVVVAGSDGLYLARAGQTGPALFHAIPGLLIAVLAGTNARR